MVELLIPTFVLLFGADIKTAGSLSLAVSLPTMLIAFARYSRDRSFAVLASNRAFVLVMALGSLAGSFISGQLLGIVPAGSAFAAAHGHTRPLRHQGLAASLRRRLEQLRQALFELRGKSVERVFLDRLDLG